MSAPPPRPPAASASATTATSAPATAPGSSSSSPEKDVKPTAARLASSAPSRASTLSDRSTPTGTPAPDGAIARLKFKPKIPNRAGGVKAEPGSTAASGSGSAPASSSVPLPAGAAPSSASAARGGRGLVRGGPGRGGPPTRGGFPTRGGVAQRGGAAPRGRAQIITTVAAGPLGVRQQSQAPRTGGPISRGPINTMRPGDDDVEIEQYSDDDDEGSGSRTPSGSAGAAAQRVIDIDAVPRLGESAPTSLYRERELPGKATGAKDGKRAVEIARRRVSRRRTGASGTASAAPPDSAAAGAGAGVKAEPISPDKLLAALPDRGAAPEADEVGDDDVQDDRDERGRRVRQFVGDAERDSSEDVNAAQRVDLSESEDDDFEESMEGDFVPTPGYDHPEDRLFTFQFPSAFPHFVAPPAASGNGDGDAKPDVKPDTKPSAAALRGGGGRGARGGRHVPPPEGRIGTLAVMRSGRVKMVLGDGIVMDVTPGLPATFLQQLVHVDHRDKSAAVLGEVAKQYVVVPDVDRLLEELWAHGGKTPGEKERAAELERRRALASQTIKVE